MVKTFAEISESIRVAMRGRITAMDAITFSGDVYLYGIWSGTSTRFISEYLQENQIQYGKMFGFDSFTGFPKEGGQHYLDKRGNVVSRFNEGEFSSAELYDCSVVRVVDIITKGIKNKRLKFIPGFFSDTLNGDLLKKEVMNPASFIEIDVDLYTSTQNALEFMFGNHLIIPGTVIYFDDWGATKQYKGGESLAWKEAIEKHSVDVIEIYSGGLRQSVQKVFRIL